MIKLMIKLLNLFVNQSFTINIFMDLLLIIQKNYNSWQNVLDSLDNIVGNLETFQNNSIAVSVFDFINYL